MTTEMKDLAYYKANAEEDYLHVPISVLRYIQQLEDTLSDRSTRARHVAIDFCLEQYHPDESVSREQVEIWFNNFIKPKTEQP